MSCETSAGLSSSGVVVNWRGESVPPHARWLSPHKGTPHIPLFGPFAEGRSPSGSVISPFAF